MQHVARDMQHATCSVASSSQVRGKWGFASAEIMVDIGGFQMVSCLVEVLSWWFSRNCVWRNRPDASSEKKKIRAGKNSPYFQYVSPNNARNSRSFGEGEEGGRGGREGGRREEEVEEEEEGEVDRPFQFPFQVPEFLINS